VVATATEKPRQAGRQAGRQADKQTNRQTRDAEMGRRYMYD
jgi:hypothetical protein